MSEYKKYPILQLALLFQYGAQILTCNYTTVTGKHFTTETKVKHLTAEKQTVFVHLSVIMTPFNDRQQICHTSLAAASKFTPRSAIKMCAILARALRQSRSLPR